ncbi:DUF6445 family protein [Bradyrhizobium sp. AZCC 1699]|uniref:DUF6445 family protein n=1 Tax=Bradyrhizobium sp. AZCC 1699 TaxID=3117024 RepID=UPI002FF064FE
MTTLPPTVRDVLVVDDFYSNAQAVRQLALRLEYFRADQSASAACQTKQWFISPRLVEKFSELVGHEVIYDNYSGAAFGTFRLLREHDVGRMHVHADLHEWAGLVHLSLNENCRGGTGLFRHKETGLTGPPTDPEAKALGFRSAAAFEEEVLLHDTKVPSQWELTHFAAAKFNRLVLFRGSQFYHGYVNVFGKEREDARLTQNFFFNGPQID